MVTKLPVRRGISNPIIGSVPTEWDAQWFRRFVTNYLNPADVRSSTEGAGMIVAGGPGAAPATLGPGQINPTVTPTQVPAGNTEQGILPLGNIMPMVQNETFTYTSTTSSITFTWPSYTVYRPDGVTTITVVAGSVTINGLTPSTTYNAYAYSPETTPTMIMFVTGFSGSVGTPQIAFPSTVTYAQTTAAFANGSQLSNILQGTLTGVTTSSGSGGGGGGGGGFGCPHPEQPVHTSTGDKLAKELRIGDMLQTPTGWSAIRAITYPWKHEWIIVKTTQCDPEIVTPEHRFVDEQGDLVMAKDLKLGQYLSFGVSVQALFLLKETTQAVALELEDPHTYFMTPTSPLSHNLKP